MGDKEFIAGKQKALNSLQKAYEEKKVDKEIISLLKIINKSPKYYSSSSCAGRIVILELPCIGDKKNAQFLGKWHKKVTSQEILDSLQKAQKGYIWMLAQSPIFHIVTDTSTDADILVKTAVSCGFKNSSIKSFGKKNVVEICSTERLDAPLGRDRTLYYKEKYIINLVEIANDILEKSQAKLLQFENLLGTII